VAATRAPGGFTNMTRLRSDLQSLVFARRIDRPVIQRVKMPSGGSCCCYESIATTVYLL
jgi:hypothetical protein